MNTTVEDLLRQAMIMPAKDRAFIAECLIASLDANTELEVEPAWQQEIQRRVGEIDSGSIVCVPWEQVLERLRQNSRNWF